MTTKGTFARTVLALCIGAAAAYSVTKLSSCSPLSRRMGEVHTSAPQEVIVLRTPGGLLEVSRIHATESFDTRFVYEVLGIEVGETVPRIRLPAVYRYHIELAPEWQVVRDDRTFTVIVPPVKPSLPVAVDLGRMEKEVSGSWVLVPFTQDEDLDDLERTLTGRLARKATLPAYIDMQRPHARKTVAEFVAKWLITQTKWTSATPAEVRVLFADEPVGAVGLGAIPPPSRPSRQSPSGSP